MNSGQNEILVQKYFDSLDGNDPSLIRHYFTHDFELILSNALNLSGKNALDEYFANHRSVKNSSHELDVTMHENDMSVISGHVTCEIGGKIKEWDFCNFFYFRGNKISCIKLFTNLS